MLFRRTIPKPILASSLALLAGCNLNPSAGSHQVAGKALPPPGFENAVIEGVAGNGTRGSGNESDPLRCPLREPADLAVAADGTLWFAEKGNLRIRMIMDGVLSTFFSQTSNNPNDTLTVPQGLCLRGNSLFIGDGLDLYRTNLDGTLEETLHLNELGGRGDNAVSVAVDSNGKLFYSAENACLIRSWDESQLVRVAGTGVSGFSGDGGSATEAQLESPQGIALDPRGNLFVADSGNHRIRKLAPSGAITTVAGNGKSETVSAGKDETIPYSARLGTFDGDGELALCKALNFPEGVAVSSSGHLFIADTANRRVRVVLPDGKIYTLAGTGVEGDGGDGGKAFQATFKAPSRLALDPAEQFLYVSDRAAHRVRRIRLK